MTASVIDQTRHFWGKAWFKALAMVFDTLGLFLAWHTAVEVRVLLNPLMTYKLTVSQLNGLVPPFYEVMLLWFATSILLGVYHRRRGSSFGAHLRTLTQSTIVLNLSLVMLVFFSRQFGSTDLSRSFVLLLVPVSFLGLLLANYAMMSTAIMISGRWMNVERVAVAGYGHDAEAVLQQLSGFNGAGTRTVGIIMPYSASDLDQPAGIPVLGNTRSLAAIINQQRLDRIIVANGSLPQDEYAECTQVARRMGVATAHALSTTEEPGMRYTVHSRYGMPMVELEPLRFTRAAEVVKRALDIVLAGGTLVLVSPLMLLCIALIKLTSPGPVFYLSNRVGKGGRHFKFLKFRSMYVDADRRKAALESEGADGHIFKLRNDPRITPVGRLLRRSSLDEMPQLINVLMGDMSLVGPRPLPASDLDPDGQSTRFERWARGRSEVLPGITGLWQIRGRSELPFEKMIEYDLEYIDNWSVTLDLEILLETPFAVFVGRGAY